MSTSSLKSSTGKAGFGSTWAFLRHRQCRPFLILSQTPQKPLISSEILSELFPLLVSPQSFKAQLISKCWTTNAISFYCKTAAVALYGDSCWICLNDTQGGLNRWRNRDTPGGEEEGEDSPQIGLLWVNTILIRIPTGCFCLLSGVTWFANWKKKKYVEESRSKNS